MRIHNGQVWITIIGPDGRPLKHVGSYDLNTLWKRDIQRDNRRHRMARKKRRGWA